MMELRPSKLSEVERCVAAAMQAAVRIRRADEESRLGTAVHDALQMHIRGLIVDIEDIARIHDVSIDDVQELFSIGMWIWDNFSKFFPEPQVEKELAAIFGTGANMVTLKGHPDVFSLHSEDMTLASCFDWKSGRLDKDHSAQMKGYALLIFENYPNVKRVWVGVARIRDRVIDGDYLYPADVYNWWWRLVKRLFGEVEYTPGRHCLHCERSHECPAMTALGVQSFEIVQQKAKTLYSAVKTGMLPEDKTERWALFADLMDRCALTQSAINHLAGWIKQKIYEEGGGPVQLPDGSFLATKSVQRTEINFEKGADVLKNMVGTLLPKCLKVSKGVLMKLYRSCFARGAKQAAEADLMFALQEAGAITTKSSLQIWRSNRADEDAIPTDKEATGPAAIANTGPGEAAGPGHGEHNGFAENQADLGHADKQD